MRDNIDPVLVNEDKTRGKEYAHPAFGMISYGTTQGHQTFVGSDLTHQHGIRLTIETATLHRDLARDWFHGREALVTIDMSQQQWATFVSSPNTSGVPCTLRYRAPEGVGLMNCPGVTVSKKHELHKAELEKYSNETLKAVKALVKKMDDMGNGTSIKKSEFRELTRELNIRVGNLAGNLGFHVESHKEMMDDAVAAAKSDIEGYVTDMIYRTGLDVIQSKAPSLSMLQSPPTLEEPL